MTAACIPGFDTGTAQKGAYLGVDIGGTKCALVLADARGKLLLKEKFATCTDKGKQFALDTICRLARQVAHHSLRAVGVSCGGPLDAKSGRILSPPNLPGWDDVPIAALLREQTGAPVFLQNDADACALAEWQFGAGRGARHMLFLTFGTGLGCGMILNGQLYTGACSMAGEVGHIRLARGGPVGYGKAGSFEGFCSGGGLAQVGGANAAELAALAEAGDVHACALYAAAGRRLGQGLAILIDTLNPECIVIGSIYARSGHLMERAMQAQLKKEALPQSLAACRIVKAALGEQLGDIAAVSVAMHGAGICGAASGGVAVP